METHREKQGPVAQPTQRFSDRVDYYIKYRPGYPAEIITFLTEVCGLAPDRTGFLASTGTGVIVDPAGNSANEPDYVWDNHMLRIG